MNALLLDTIVLLWWLAGDARLDLGVTLRIKQPRNRVYVSVASAWEICALERNGQVSFGKPARDCLPSELTLHRFEWLPIDSRHVFAADHFRRDELDVYDRLILAQAAVERLALATTNDRMRTTGVEIVEGRRPGAGVRPLPVPKCRVRRVVGKRGEPVYQLEPARARTRAPSPGLNPEERPIPAWNATPWGNDDAAEAAVEAAGITPAARRGPSA